MEFIEDISNLKLKDTVVTIGKFDGFHIGHMRLFDIAGKYKTFGRDVVIFMLDAKPNQINGSSYAGDLYSLYEKKHFNYPSYIDKVILYHFDKNVMSMTPEDFVESILLDKLGVSEIVVGCDFGFGKNRSGNVKLLKELGLKFGFCVTAASKVMFKNEEVSSTRIKHAVSRCEFRDAEAMLNRPYFVCAEIVPGARLGRSLGFPTINMNIPECKLIPPVGVYAVSVLIDNKKYAGMCNIGAKPTVNKSGRINIETHILDFEGDLYGRILTVQFYKFIRGEIKFASIGELKEALKEGEFFVRDYFSSNALGV